MPFDDWVSAHFLAPVNWTQVSYFRCANRNKVKGSLCFPYILPKQSLNSHFLKAHIHNQHSILLIF